MIDDEFRFISIAKRMNRSATALRAQGVTSPSKIPLSRDQGPRGTMTQDSPRPEVIIGHPFSKLFEFLPFPFLHHCFVASEINPRSTVGVKRRTKRYRKPQKACKHTVQEGVREKYAKKQKDQTPRPSDSVILYSMCYKNQQPQQIFQKAFGN